MPARMPQDHRVVRRHRVERLVGWKSLDTWSRRNGPLFLMPSAPADPFARLRLFNRLRNALDDLIPTGGVQQFEISLVLADPCEVPVSLDESRHRELTVQVDDLRGRSNVI